MRNFDSQVAGSAQSSLSLLSDPPDIKNWFSSYTYQSPELDTNEDFDHPLKVDEEERGLYVEDSENEEEENYNNLTQTRKTYKSSIRCSNTWSVVGKSTEGTRMHNPPPPAEVPAYPDSLSLPSEPPDIRNWFPSYVYESPALDSADFDVSPSKGCDFGKIGELGKREENLKELIATNVKYEPSFQKETISNNYAAVTRSIRVENSKNHSASQEKDDSEESNLSSKNNFFPERTSDQSSQRATWERHDIVQVNSEGRPIIQAHYLTSPSQAPYRKECKETGEVNNNNNIPSEFMETENDSGWILPNRKSREVERKSIKNKNTEYPSAENRCTSLKKKASSKIDENSPSLLGSSKCKYNRNVNPISSTYNGKDEVVRREALNEMTNFQHSYEMEVAGKWRCPQRSKPDTGPPLKQLRLERWVHRI